MENDNMNESRSRQQFSTSPTIRVPPMHDVGCWASLLTNLGCWCSCWTLHASVSSALSQSRGSWLHPLPLRKPDQAVPFSPVETALHSRDTTAKDLRADRTHRACSADRSQVFSRVPTIHWNPRVAFFLRRLHSIPLVSGFRIAQDNVGALIIRIGFEGILYYNYNNEPRPSPPPPKKKV